MFGISGRKAAFQFVELGAYFVGVMQFSALGGGVAFFDLGAISERFCASQTSCSCNMETARSTNLSTVW